MTEPLAGTIPLFATRSALEPLLDEVAQRQRAVLESGRYVLGPELLAFESEFAAACGRRHCVGVANGTDALTLALRALGVGAGDEVIVPGVTFFATVEGIIHSGARPVVCDIDPATHCMTASTAAPAIGERTRAILPVHLFGNPAPMAELGELAAQHDLVLLADAAQAAGAEFEGRPAGAFGDAATFSFYPGKNLGAFGDGGAIVTDDPTVADRARLLRNHAQREPWNHVDAGYNSRLDDIQAAALRVLLPHLAEWTAARRRVAAAYETAGLGEIAVPPAETGGARSAFHLYVPLIPGRDGVALVLADRGIETRPYYTTPTARQPALRDSAPPALTNSERLAAEGLALPMGPGLSIEAVETVVEALRGAVAPRD